MIAYISPPTECFNPPWSRWIVGLSLRCSSDGRNTSKICTCSLQTWPQSWTPCNKPLSAAEHKPLPLRNWIQRSQYPLFIRSVYLHRAGWFGCSWEAERECWGNFIGYSEETRSLSGWTSTLRSKLVFKESVQASLLSSLSHPLVWPLHLFFFSFATFYQLTVIRLRVFIAKDFKT